MPLKRIVRRREVAVRTVKILAIAAVAVLAGFGFVYTIFQSVFLSYGFTDEAKNIVSIELITYEGDVFNSTVESVKTLAPENEKIGAFVKSITRQQVSVLNLDKRTSQVILFKFSGGKSVNAFVGGSSLGFDFGSLWVKIDGLADYLNAFM